MSKINQKPINNLNIDIDQSFVKDTNLIIEQVNKNITGRVCVTNYLHMARYIKRNFIKKKDGVYLETGTLFGGSISVLIQDPDPWTFIGVDIFNGYYARGKDPMSGKDVNINIVKNNIDNFNKYGHKVELIKGSSYDKNTVEAVKSKIKNIDLLFIDGHHSEKGVNGDYNSYKNMVTKDGFIIFDNYGDPTCWQGVKKAVDQINFDRDNFEKIGQYGFSFIVRKK